MPEGSFFNFVSLRMLRQVGSHTTRAQIKCKDDHYRRAHKMVNDIVPANTVFHQSAVDEIHTSLVKGLCTAFHKHESGQRKKRFIIGRRYRGRHCNRASSIGHSIAQVSSAGAEPQFSNTHLVSARFSSSGSESMRQGRAASRRHRQSLERRARVRIR